jgi:F-type H+-transporting ATPase subunit gamma
MASTKEIRTKIKSVKSTQKITKAMEMVAASKMRKAQDRVMAARPYAEKIRRSLGHLKQASGETHHPFLTEREVKRVGLIVISTDRGLCGGLNINLFRATVAALREWKEKGVETELVVVGAKAIAFFKRFGGKVVAETSHLGDRPHLESLIGPVKVLLDAHREGRVDQIQLISNVFVNTMTQRPTMRQLVPLVAVEEEGMAKHWDYIYEPDPADLLDSILLRYVESQVYQGLVENVACEMAARMVAMKNATNNAGELIDRLQLVYNKARQAAITQELAEIVGGAAAV